MVPPDRERSPAVREATGREEGLRSAPLPASAGTLVVVAVIGVVFGFIAQLLRQVSGPVIALGAATAPWLTIGFVSAMWATRPDPAGRRRSIWIGIAAMLLYLVGWLAAYHLTFSIRESVPLAAGWREAAPWFALAGPASVILGIAATLAHRSGITGDVSLVLPVAWSTPEIIALVMEGWSYALVVALPTIVLVLTPFVAIARRDVRSLHGAVACVAFALIGLAVLPLVQLYVPTY